MTRASEAEDQLGKTCPISECPHHEGCFILTIRKAPPKVKEDCTYCPKNKKKKYQTSSED